MTQFSATIRKANGEEYTSLIDAADADRAKEIALELAAAGDGEALQSVEPVAEAPEGEAADDEGATEEAPAEEETTEAS